MTNENKTDGKDRQRVVLNLSIEQAQKVKEFLGDAGDETCRKICQRIEKTLNKHGVQNGN
jgi:hypothetical protein